MSTFRELYDDWRSQILIYTEKLTSTEIMFMRYLTRGMQLFQRRVLLAEASVRLQRRAVQTQTPNGIVTSQEFFAPDELLMEIEVRDSNGLIMLSQEYTQQQHVMETDISSGRVRGPWAHHIPYGAGYPSLGYDTEPYPSGPRSGIGYANGDEYKRTYSRWNRQYLFYPSYTGADLFVRYYPNVDAISAASPQWTDWYVNDDAWTTNFNSRTISSPISHYEHAILDFAISMYLKSISQANYKVFENNFYQEIEQAKIEKPVPNRMALAEYNFAPWT